MQDRVEVKVVPETELGVVQIRPDVDETETVNATVPLKPLRSMTVIVETAVLVSKTGEGVTALEDIEKSTTWKTMLPVVRETAVPLIVEAPVTVTV